jgi:predicted glutamine amidotransferase
MGMEYQPKKALEKMLASILSIMHKNNIQGALRATIAACDGFSTYTMRYGSETDHCPTLYYTDKDGVYNITSDSRVKHNPNPATLVISEPLDHSPSVYEPIKNGEFLTLASNGRIEHDDLCF